MNEHHRLGFVFDLRVGDEAVHGTRAALDLHPFQMAGRFLQPTFSPVLSHRIRTHKYKKQAHRYIIRFYVFHFPL